MAGVLFPNLCKPPQLQRWYREGGNTCPQAMSLTHGTLDTHQSRTIKKSTFLVKRLQCKYGTLHNRRKDLVPCVLVCLGVTAMSSWWKKTKVWSGHVKDPKDIYIYIKMYLSIYLSIYIYIYNDEIIPPTGIIWLLPLPKEQIVTEP